MIITRLELTAFKRHHRFEMKLGPGLTVIKGPNESGKSTIVEAFLAAFFTGTTATKEIESFAEWGGDRKPRVVMEVEDEEGAATIEKDFDNKKIKISCNGKTISSQKKANQWIEERLGFGRADIFLATACIHNSEVKVAEVDMKSGVAREILDRLQAMLTGAPGGSPSQVASRLKKRYNEIKQSPGKQKPEGGPVVAARRRLEQAREELQKAQQDRDEWERLSLRLEQLNASVAEKESKKNELNSALEKHRLYKQAQKDHDEMRERLERILRANELLKERLEMEERIAKYKGPEDMGPAVARLEEIQKERRSLEEKQGDLKLERYENRLNLPTWSAAFPLTAVLLFAAGFLVPRFTEFAWALWAGLGGGALFVLLFVFRFLTVKSRENKRCRDLDSRMIETDDRLDSLHEEENGILSRSGKGSVDELRKDYEEYEELASAIADRGERVAELAGEDATRESLQAKSRELSVNISVATERMESLENFCISDPVRLSSLEDKASRLEEELNELLSERTTKKAQIDALGFDISELALLEEKEAEQSRRLEYWEREQRVHEKALEVLEESAEAIVLRAGEVIEKEVSPVISAFTSGRYGKVKADSTLRIYLYSGKLGDWICEEDLSMGTCRQLQLAARLALVKLVSKDKTPPIILDDPLAHYDPQRRDHAMQTIKEFSKNFQVILLSPDDRYSSYADGVVELEV